MQEKVITTYHETFNLKTKKEIIEFWRQLHFLDGIKEGSQNEWRCAKSFELMANFLQENEQYSGFSYTVGTFPLIRRLICAERPRCHRIIAPEEIITPMTTVTIGEIFDVLEPFIKNNDKKNMLFKYLKFRNLLVNTVSEFLDNCEDNRDIILLNNVLEFNIQTEIFAIFSKYLSVKIGK